MTTKTEIKDMKLQVKKLLQQVTILECKCKVETDVLEKKILVIKNETGYTPFMLSRHKTPEQEKAGNDILKLQNEIKSIENKYDLLKIELTSQVNQLKLQIAEAELELIGTADEEPTLDDLSLELELLSV